MESPLITIIVPVYNVRHFLPACFDSLRKQIYPNCEFLLVDDGSTDGSGVACDEFAKTDARVRVIHQENLGLSGARNRGIKEARGEYLAFLDSDDAIAPDYVSYLFSLAKKYQATLAICGLKEITLKKREINYAADYPEKAMSTEETLGRMLREEGFTVVAYAKLYHKSLWQGIEFPLGALHEDLATTYKVVERAPRVAFGPEAKYIYIKRASSISNSEFSEKKLDIIKFTDEMCADLEKKFPYLINTVNLRRMHARFSVLRQLVQVSDLDPALAAKEQEIIDYLVAHKKHIFKNPHATSRDKLAMQSLLANKNVFKFAWKAYSKLRK